VSVVLGEKEGAGVELHQDVTLADGPQLQHQNRIVIPESRQKAAIEKEGGHAIRAALRDVREPQQQAARVLDSDSTRLGFLGTILAWHARGHVTDRA